MFIGLFVWIGACLGGGMLLMQSSPGIAVPLMGGGIVVGTVYAVFSFGKPTKADKDLMEHGIEAEATILSVQDTGITINDINYVVKLTLRVKPPTTAAFESTAEVTVSRVAIPSPGETLRVKYDPAKPGHCIVVRHNTVFDDAPKVAPHPAVADRPNYFQQARQPEPQATKQSSGIDSEAAQQMLHLADVQTRQLQETGTSAKAVVVEFHPLGVYVNAVEGVRAKLTVMPEGEEGFTADVVGLVDEPVWPFYQPGQILEVKYDPSDKTRVAFYKSGADAQ